MKRWQKTLIAVGGTILLVTLTFVAWYVIGVIHWLFTGMCSGFDCGYVRDSERELFGILKWVALAVFTLHFFLCFRWVLAAPKNAPPNGA